MQYDFTLTIYVTSDVFLQPPSPAGDSGPQQYLLRSRGNGKIITTTCLIFVYEITMWPRTMKQIGVPLCCLFCSWTPVRTNLFPITLSLNVERNHLIYCRWVLFQTPGINSNHIQIQHVLKSTDYHL